MSRTIIGFSDSEQELYVRLRSVLEAKAPRNQLRDAYMDGKRALSMVSATTPEYLRHLAIVLGWPAKAVETLARRIKLEGFAIPGDELSTWGIDELVRDNDYVAESGQGRLAALTHSVAFEVVTKGLEAAGEPVAQISRVSALDGTGDWNPRSRRLETFLWVHEREDKGGTQEVTEFTLFYGDQVVSVVGGKVVDRQRSIVPVPVNPFPYKPRLRRPFGSSRISRPVMGLTDSAMRTILRSEGTADFYGAPWFMIFGPSEDDFSKGAFQLLFDRVNAIPDNTDPEITNQRASVQQFTQASQAPHVEQLQVWAGLFAGETSIPVSSLGVGLSQANPTSAESYLASREDVIAEAEDASSNWSSAHARSILWAWQIANNEPEIPEELQKLTAVWRDQRYTSRAAAADATLKTVQAFPWMSESDAVVETLGFDRTMTERLLADKRRAGGSSLLAQLSTLSVDSAGGGVSELERANVLKVKLDALGAGIRSGATFESLLRLLDLEGVEDSGSVPVSLRVPVQESTQFEDRT